MGNRRRGRPFREVKALTVARVVGSSEATGEIAVLLSGLSSLLHVGFHLAFFPNEGKRPDDAAFAGNTFAIYGWTCDERGQRVQLASEAVTGATPLQLPDGWAGRTELDQLELRATLTTLGTDGDWRAIVVLEPGDGAMCEEVFDALIREIQLGPVRRPVLIEGS